MSTYVHYDDSLVPQWTNLYTSCIDIRADNIVFSGLTSQLRIPASTNTAPDSTDVVVWVWSNNPTDKSVWFGNVFSIPTFSSKGTYLQMNLTTDQKLTGVVENSMISIFDTNTLVETISIADNMLWFRTDIQLFNRYPTSLTGQMALNVGDTLTLNVAGTMSGLAQDVEEYIHTVMTIEAQAAAYRQELDSANRKGAANRLATLESEVVSREAAYNQLTTTSSQLAMNLETAYQLTMDKEMGFFAIVPSELMPQVEQVCSKQQCGTVCQFDGDIKHCTSNTAIPVEIPCTIDVSNLAKALVQGTQPVQYCEDENYCETDVDIRWAKLEVGSRLVSLPYSTLVDSCIDRCATKTEEEPILELQDQNSTQDALSLCISWYYTANFSYSCWGNDTCAFYIDEEPCWTGNHDCTDLKMKKVLQLVADDPLNGPMLFTLYTQYMADQENEISLKAEVYELSLQVEAALEEWNLAKVELEYAKILNDSIDSSNKLNSTRGLLFLNWIEEHGSPEDVILINSLEFTASFMTQSPNDLEIQVNFTIPFFSNETIVNDLSIDFSTSYGDIQKAFLDGIVAWISSQAQNVGRKRSLVKRGAQDTSALQFQMNCVDINRMSNYLSLLSETIVNSSQATAVSSQYISSVLDALEAHFSQVALDSVNVSNKYSTALFANQQRYLELARSLYSNVSKSIVNADFIFWLRMTEKYHSDVVTDPDDQCYNLVDCLNLVLDYSVLLLEPLARVDASALSLQSSILLLYQDLLVLPTNPSTSLSSINKTVSSMYNLVWQINNFNYWCSSEPVITTHPNPEVFAAFGDTVTLSCEATSSLPLAYQWLKDGVLLDGSTEPDLVITNFQAPDVATYTCQAINNVSCVNSLPSLLKSYDPPVILSISDDYATYAGDELGVWFKCEAESYPLPYWNWYFKGDNDDSWSLIVNATDSVLSINKPDHSNQGWYWCVAKNEFSSAQSEPIRLTIVDGAVSRKRYSIRAAVDYSPPQLVSSGSGDTPGQAETNTTQAAYAIETWLWSIISDTNADITNYETTWMNETRVMISFYLNTKSLSSEYVLDPEILSPQYLAAVQNLAIARDLLKGKVEEGASFSPGAMYTFVSVSYWEGYLTFTCPTGHDLHFNYIVCCELYQYKQCSHLLTMLLLCF